MYSTNSSRSSFEFRCCFVNGGLSISNRASLCLDNASGSLDNKSSKCFKSSHSPSTFTKSTKHSIAATRTSMYCPYAAYDRYNLGLDGK